MLVSPDPNGRPAPNIHTWDSHMPYGYFPEMFENFTKLSKFDRFLEQNALGELHTCSKKWSEWLVSRDVPDLNCSSRPHFPFGATPPLGVLSSNQSSISKTLQKINSVRGLFFAIKTDVSSDHGSTANHHHAGISLDLSQGIVA